MKSKCKTFHLGGSVRLFLLIIYSLSLYPAFPPEFWGSVLDFFFILNSNSQNRLGWEIVSYIVLRPLNKFLWLRMYLNLGVSSSSQASEQLIHTGSFSSHSALTWKLATSLKPGHWICLEAFMIKLLYIQLTIAKQTVLAKRRSLREKKNLTTARLNKVVSDLFHLAYRN